MANMFSGRKEKEIPRTLNECTKTDATVSNLHDWAERLESWGKILFIILICVGVFATIAEAVATYELHEEINRISSPYEMAQAGMDVPSVFDVVVTSLFKWGFYAFIEYCTYHVLALLISALASITQNTIISANVALLQATGSGKFGNEATPEKQTTSNENITGTTATSDITPGASRTAPPPSLEDKWICDVCGTSNSTNYGQCKKCGKFRS